MIHYIENQRINDEVLNNQDKLVLVYFFTEWSMPCEEQVEILNEIDKQYGDEVVFDRVNLEDNSETKIRFHIQGTPTILFFREGEEIERREGVIRKEELEKLINELK